MIQRIPQKEQIEAYQKTSVRKRVDEVKIKKKIRAEENGKNTINEKKPVAEQKRKKTEASSPSTKKTVRCDKLLYWKQRLVSFGYR